MYVSGSALTSLGQVSADELPQPESADLTLLHSHENKDIIIAVLEYQLPYIDPESLLIQPGQECRGITLREA